MNMQTQSGASDVAIPESLARQFRRLTRRLWWVDTVVALCGACAGVMLSWVLLLASDRFWDTPVWARYVCAGVGAAAAAWFLWSWVWVWIMRPRDRRRLARLVQGCHRRLGDRLQGIIELIEAGVPAGRMSPALCRAAVRQVADEASALEFRDAVALRRPRLFALAAVSLIALIGAAWTLVPAAAQNALARWLRPGDSIERFTFVSLDALPSTLVVPHGEPFSIACGVSWRSFWRPGLAVGRMGALPPMRVPVSGGAVRFDVPGQTAPGDFWLRLGDVSRVVRIEPRVRPALRRMEARVTPPEYLQRTDAAEEATPGFLTVVEGARAAFVGHTSRMLGSVSATLFGTAAGETRALKTTTGADGFATEAAAWDDGDRIEFEWEDLDGLAAREPWVLSLRVRSDDAPEAACPGQPATVAMLADEILEIEAEGTDDFGVRRMVLAWQCRRPPETNVLAWGEEPVADGGPEARSLRGIYRFSPAQLKLPEDVLVTLHAAVWDYFPDRPASRSAEHQVFVLSDAEHARLVHRELAAMAAELEELTRRQEALREAMRQSEAEEESAAAASWAEQSEGERRLAAALAKLSERAGSTVREALRNESIPADLLERWAEQAAGMQEVAGQLMQPASLALSFAAQSGGRAEESIREAAALESRALERLWSMQKDLAAALDQLLANTLAHRLRRLARTESDIGKELAALLPSTIGLAAEALREPHQGIVAGLGRDQESARRDALQLQREIERFFERTTREAYGNVATSMRTNETSLKLAELARNIQANLAGLSRDAALAWEARFGGWAEQLEAAQRAAGAGSGAGSGTVSDAALQRLLTLLRLRQIQLNVRDHTGLLEERRGRSQSYREDAMMLSIRQLYLEEDTGNMARLEPGGLLGAASQAMGEAERDLRRPRTDASVVSLQTDAANLLEGAIMDMIRLAQGTPSASAMTMMMQSMGMGAGATAGGSMAGGWPDGNDVEVGGDVRGAPVESRAAETGRGAPGRAVPLEFREALRHYQRRLDELNGRSAAERP